MFDIFTGPAKRVVVRAQDEAVSLGHDFIGTGHLLLGLAEVPGGLAAHVLTASGVTAAAARARIVSLLGDRELAGRSAQDVRDALATLGIDVAKIQQRADETFGSGRFVFPRPPFTAGGKKILEGALGESRALGHDYVGTEHVLLGLLARSEGVAVEILAELGADRAVMRAQTVARIAAGDGEVDGEVDGAGDADSDGEAAGGADVDAEPVDEQRHAQGDGRREHGRAQRREQASGADE